MQCVFCDIVNKKSPTSVIFENDDFLAFSPIKQISKGHTLLISKEHTENLFDINDEALAKIAVLSKKLAAELVKKHSATGVNILHASGKDAQQSVPHFHIHLVPRYPNDGLDLWLKNKL
ncbi:MAG: hypothetical protein A3A22_02055 [Candidatus Taylorbacteria bacterium RIFCSPLOWO2_01_FULL_45_34b]|nr:MAG: hypothetical protein A3A22_02055 [Candidatus Taylorbacteria bacterium RIFCSPLOWO2_01_FULL_45_34b]